MNDKNRTNYKLIRILMSKPTKNCIMCNKEYKTYDISSKFCSSKCYFESKRSFVDCAQCNKKIIVIASRSSHFLFCSNACDYESMKVDRLYKNCIKCGVKYALRRDHIKRSKFCSKSCQCSWMGLKATKNIHEKWEQETPEETKQKIKESFERFFEKGDGCWIWTGGNRGKLGYGAFAFRIRKPLIAHRVSYELYNGEIPKGKIIMHTCDNPPCVNPTHLKVGTHLENARDKILKGRCKINKLSVENVKEIKKLLRIGVRNDRIAQDFGVSSSAVSLIKLGKTWSWLSID